MTTFNVSLDELSAVVVRLDVLSNELRNAKGNTPGYACQTGSDAVTAALDGYFADWSDGMHIIDANVESLAHKLAKTEAAYGDVEGALVQDMAGGASAS
jgi:hypothetical protein